MLHGLMAQWNKTVLLVTHDLDEAVYLADRIVFIAEGKLIARPCSNGVPALSAAGDRELCARLSPRWKRGAEGACVSSEFLAEYGSEIATLTLEHLWLTAAAMLLATVIAVPAAIWLTRATRWAKPVMAAANVLQTIPSLAMFGFLLPLPWLGDRAARIAIVALTAYALLPILRNTYAGIRGIDSAVIEVGARHGPHRLAKADQGGAAFGGSPHSRRP